MRSRWRFPLLFTAGVLAYVFVCDLILTPIHEEHGWEWTGWLNGLARILALPGLCVAESTGARFRHRTGWGAWLVMLLTSVPLYTLVGFVLRWMWAPRPRKSRGGTPLNPHQPDVHPRSDAAADLSHEQVPAETRDIPSPGDDALVSRRGLLLAARRTAVVGIAGTAAYSFLVELRNVEVTRQSIPIRGLPQTLAGLRIVQLTDLHHGPWTSLSYIRRVVDQANALKPDLIVLTGDYVHQSDRYIAPVVEAMAGLKGRIGVVATLGNHDWWENGELMIRELDKTSIRRLDNSRLFITSERTLESGVGRTDQKHVLCVAGLGDLWEGSPDCGEALGGVPDFMPRVLLSHNPDTAEEPCVRKHSPRIDLMLSGHTHGGQVSFPGIGTPITPSRYGQKYAAGLVQSPSCPVYVNRGIGTTIIPMRFRVRPEIAVIELQAG
ncbi:metallophosphoesterase [Humisphaera borealis]|uniref:Metallophosphoesterase n=1 Tax=Humisphaera borealis TaxID=2807512 RepID=A0A7M2WWG8_9BACT|nr:metallophosphoesterase [Humisphaera borealis]QOV89664.1 metallophosphoesterase [Humisphaera borealis]